MPNLLEYTNYRTFLSDFVKSERRRKTSFSLRGFSEKAQLSSPSHLGMVIDGKRNLTLESIEKFTRGLGLKGKERDFFRHLVLFNQESDPIGKVHQLEQLKKIRFSIHSKKIAFDDQASLYDPWYLPVLYEAVLLDTFSDDPKALAELLGKRLTSKQIMDGLNKLKSEAWIVWDARSNRWMQRNIVVSASDECQSALIQAFHRQMAEWAIQSLPLPIAQREFGAVTIALSEEKYLILKSMIKKFIEEANVEGSQSVLKEKLYQLNIQLFPLR